MACGAIRCACWAVPVHLAAASGLGTGAVDKIALAYNHQLCPEMTVLVCAPYALNPACQRRVNLFQPVNRTTLY